MTYIAKSSLFIYLDMGVVCHEYVKFLCRLRVILHGDQVNSWLIKQRRICGLLNTLTSTSTGQYIYVKIIK